MARNDIDRARDALWCIPPDLPRDKWHTVGRAAIAAGLTISDIDEWSSTASNYKGTKDVVSAFRTITPEGGTGPGTLFKIAAEYGYEPNGKSRHRQHLQAARKAAEPQLKPAPGMSAAEVWSRCEPVTETHGYLLRKGARGVPLDDLRVLPASDPLNSSWRSLGGSLVVPAYGANGLQSLVFISPAGAGKKLNLKDEPMSGTSFVVGELKRGGTAYLCEGIGTAWACWQATGEAAVVCFGWSNVARIATDLRQKDTTARLVLVPDVGKEPEAEEIARKLKAGVCQMPQGEAQNFDANDLAQREGLEVLRTILLAPKDPAPPALPLSVAFADELPEAFNPPDELVEGVLTADGGSVLYGDSNSGKTFFVIDMAAAVARGQPWMGKNTEKGLVVYLAAESPVSVRSRLQAYQKHHGVRVPNFAIVQSPVDLFDGEADTESVITVVQQLEQQRGQKVRLIVGDTLARLSAGANENAGQDMGLVVRRIDRIRTVCAAHFLLIHHSGKAAANGARGWSGIRAAVDTEIEVTDTPAGRCAEITKQRDLGTKNERIGFRLEPLTLGKTKWGAPATSCVVIASDAPEKKKGKRLSECDGAVLEFLAGHKVGIRKADVVKHFTGRYEKGPVYRSMKALVTASAIHEAAGMVAIAEAAK